MAPLLLLLSSTLSIIPWTEPWQHSQCETESNRYPGFLMQHFDKL